EIKIWDERKGPTPVLTIERTVTYASELVDNYIGGCSINSLQLFDIRSPTAPLWRTTSIHLFEHPMLKLDAMKLVHATGSSVTLYLYEKTKSQRLTNSYRTS